MSGDKINKLAHSVVQQWDSGTGHMLTDLIAVAIAESLSIEREACAKIADYFAENSGVARNIAAAIRVRGDGRVG